MKSFGPATWCAWSGSIMVQCQYKVLNRGSEGVFLVIFFGAETMGVTPTAYS
jgi:hypothetical protein